jgi:hypothetical protein
MPLGMGFARQHSAGCHVTASNRVFPQPASIASAKALLLCVDLRSETLDDFYPFHGLFLRRRMYTMIEMATITAITILIQERSRFEEYRNSARTQSNLNGQQVGTTGCR